MHLDFYKNYSFINKICNFILRIRMESLLNVVLVNFFLHHIKPNTRNANWHN